MVCWCSEYIFKWTLFNLCICVCIERFLLNAYTSPYFWLDVLPAVGVLSNVSQLCWRSDGSKTNSELYWWIVVQVCVRIFVCNSAPYLPTLRLKQCNHFIPIHFSHLILSVLIVFRADWKSFACRNKNVRKFGYFKIVCMRLTNTYYRRSKYSHCFALELAFKCCCRCCCCFFGLLVRSLVRSTQWWTEWLKWKIVDKRPKQFWLSASLWRSMCDSIANVKRFKWNSTATFGIPQ